MPSHPDPPDRRANPRFAPLPGVTVDFWPPEGDSGPNVALSLLDVSRSGARLYLSPQVRPGVGIAVTLQPPDGGPSVPVAGTVVWVHTEHGIACTAGVVFDLTLEADDLARLTGLWEPG